jgi:tRNA(fMet)-specific endonuclease VapC
LVISFHEQVLGIHKQLNQARRPAELPRRYRRVDELFDLYSKSNLVLFDDSAAAVLEILRKTPKLRIRPIDPRIAAVALAQNLAPVTRNVSDFGKVPGLRTEDWTK